VARRGNKIRKGKLRVIGGRPEEAGHVSSRGGAGGQNHGSYLLRWPGCRSLNRGNKMAGLPKIEIFGDSVFFMKRG